MGCGGSSPAGGGAAQGRAAAGKSNQPKTPVLLFSLPGAAKDYLQNVINADNEANENGKLNLRFIEIPNQRSIRRYWLKELSNPRDYAVAIYLADLRDHPTLLLTARTLNWFLRNTFKKYDLKIISIYSSQEQVDEFKSYLPPVIEIFVLNESVMSTITQVKDMILVFDEKYQEAKRTRTGTTTTTTHLIMK